MSTARSLNDLMRVHGVRILVHHLNDRARPLLGIYNIMRSIKHTERATDLILEQLEDAGAIIQIFVYDNGTIDAYWTMTRYGTAAYERWLNHHNGANPLDTYLEKQTRSMI